MFTVEERDRVRNRLVQMSRADPRVVAGALIGSTAGGGGDRWSDLDLTFGLADGVAIGDVLADWTTRFDNEFNAIPIFDLPAKPAPAEQTFGLAVIYLLHTYACIARGRMWEAEYCISVARDQALSLACLHRGLKTSYGRGFDDLPSETLKPVTGTLVGSLEETRLIEALGRCVDVLLQNSQDVSELAGKLGPQLRDLSYQ